MIRHRVGGYDKSCGAARVWQWRTEGLRVRPPGSRYDSDRRPRAMGIPEHPTDRTFAATPSTGLRATRSPLGAREED